MSSTITRTADKIIAGSAPLLYAGTLPGILLRDSNLAIIGSLFLTSVAALGLTIEHSARKILGIKEAHTSPLILKIVSVAISAFAVLAFAINAQALTFYSIISLSALATFAASTTSVVAFQRAYKL